ncbi:MAG TPA: DUF4905 domain-containing protein [Candidatus Kapabacteria bacterium]|jgi:outer membrane protein assembly factor BamB|nr:DUF4905 domain-containing protein [Candidatus Kapabacteria bacterium]
MTFNLERRWTFETQSQNEVIWKLLISPAGTLAGETRNVETKTASIFAIDVATGSVRWRDVAIREPWWFASETATDATLYIQTFRTPELPEPQGIIALDMHTGKERWMQPEFSFVALGAQGIVYAMKQGFSRRDYFALDTLTGTVVQAFGEDATDAQLARDSARESDPNSYYATPLGEDHADRIRELLKGTMEINDIRGSIDVLEFGRYLILNYHARIQDRPEAALQNLLSNELIVIDARTGDLLFRETLHRETPFPLPDNFFVTHRTLIYVKEKRILVGVPLP